MATQIKIRRGLASEWTSSNPVLALGEMGFETDTRKFKFGNGLSNWSSIPYSVDKNQIGLSEVDNTSDLDKPISSLVQSALDLKANFSDVYYELGFKANVSDVEYDLSLKANIDDVDSSLALKANALDVYTKLESDDISTNTLEFANSYTDLKVAGIVNSAPETLNTLNELATALGNDPNFATTTANLIGTKADSSSVYTKTQSDSNFEAKNVNIQAHISSLSNPHEVTKTQVGLGNVDNISASNLRDRSTHTGTQLASSISDFTSAVQLVNIDAAKIDGGNVSNLEFSYLDGVTSSIQTQIDNKQDTITGAITSVLAIDLSPSKVVTSDSSGKLSNSSVSTTSLNYLDATSSIQTQINGKEPSIIAGTSLQYFRGDKSFQTLDKTAVGLGNVDNISAANLRDRTTHTGNESTLPFSEVSEPSAPASGLTVYSESVAGRQMLAQVPKAGKAYPFQPHIGMMNTQIWIPNANATTSTIWGQVAPTATGTPTLRTIATTNNFSWQRRVGFVSAATGGSTSGLRSAVLQFGTGNSVGTGGFYFQTRFGVADAVLVPNARSAIGMTATTTAFTNADPSSFLNFIGMAHDAADTNWQIMYNDGAGTATKIDLGASFSRSAGASTTMYDFVLFCSPNSTTIFYEVKNMLNGASTSGSFNTNIPANTQLLTWQLWRSNNAAPSSVALDIAIIYIETE